MLDLMTGGLLRGGELAAPAAGRPGRAALASRCRPAGEILGYGRGLAGSARRLAVASAASLNGPIGPNRRWAWAAASLAEVKEIRSALGGTVNDVLLAAITSGFRDLLDSRGELADGLVVRSLVPVSVRGPDEQGVITNRVSAVLANLPVGEPDPLRRLALLREQMDDLKQTSQAVGAEVLTGMLGLAAPTLLALGSRAAFQLPQPLVQTVTTNVPGPRLPLFLLGRKLVQDPPLRADRRQRADLGRDLLLPGAFHASALPRTTTRCPTSESWPRASAAGSPNSRATRAADPRRDSRWSVGYT